MNTFGSMYNLQPTVFDGMPLVVCPHPRLVPTTGAVPLHRITAPGGLRASRTNLVYWLPVSRLPAALQFEHMILPSSQNSF